MTFCSPADRRKKRLRPAFQATHVAAAVGLLIGGVAPALAQQAAPAPAAAASAPAGEQKAPEAKAEPKVETVYVTGIRRSLETSLNLKRDAQGMVDGIVAEDINKFPDTNLAEAISRISGVSISRENGEGSRITVRGVGPDFNLVLLNGRQMPGVGLQATSASNSRSFDFANLAAESVSALEVYKTARASTPSGGMGTTINVKTARPLDNPGLHAAFGIKGVYDQSNQRLPEQLQGDKVTPEVSGIYSNTFADGQFGVALAGSYQVRHLGFNQAGVPGGWHALRGDDTGSWGVIPQSNAPGGQNITNRPGPNDIYSVPQNTLYEVNGIRRERTNGLLTLQYKPNQDLTTTLDFVYSQNKLQWKHSELSAWYNFGPSVSSWTNGPVSAPVFYEETVANSDVAMGGAEFATKNVNNSVGLNVAWKASDRLRFEFDAHHSTAESKPDSPYGSNATIGAAQFNRGNTRTDFTNELPVLSIAGAPLDASLMQVTGSSFRNSYQKGVVDQGQVRSKLKFDNGDSVDFGLALTDVKNRSAYGFTQRDTWGGATSPADYPDGIWHADTLSQYFNRIGGANNPALYNQFYVWDFTTVRNLAAQAIGDESAYLAPSAYSVDRRTTEKSQSAFVQYNTSWDTAIPMNLSAGLRYERTKVSSSALVPIATGVEWGSNNEFTVLFGEPNFTTLKGSYSYALPSIDFDADLRRDLKFRASYGETIGRQAWNDIQGGQTLDQLARVAGGTGSQGNPALKPLKSKNFDLSLEWYYSKASYLSAGYFAKHISNYVGTQQIDASPFQVHTPAHGQWWQEAVSAGGCADSDLTCIRNYIFDHYNGVGGVVQTGVDTQGNRTGRIPGQATDPVMNFKITEPVNADKARLWGVELNWQHMFSTTGFGVQANYTWVKSGLKYDNASLGAQFALPGLSNSANLVGFYENDRFEARVAYNWRDEFLVSTSDPSGANPVYMEPYAQVDLRLGYKIDDHTTLAFEALNLTDAIQRTHERRSEEVYLVSQTGRRYVIGLSYKF